jgi:hypothetical protein
MLKDYGKDYSLDAWAFLKYGRIPQEDPTAKAVVKLSQDVTVLNEDSYVFHLKVLDKHPIRVALIADFLAEQLVVIANEADAAPAAEKRVELEALRDQKRDEINTYRATINDILTANRLTSVSQEMQERLGELYALEAEQTRLKAEIEAERHELADLDARLAAVDEVAKGGRTRNRDGSAFGRLQPEDINRMSSDKLFSEVELEGLEARSAALALSIVQTRARLEELPDLRLEIEQLEADLERVNGEYEQINVALNELVIQESESVAELRIQNPATQPTAPVTPIKIYHVGLAAVLGLTLSIGLVYVFTYFNVRIFVPSGGPKMRRYPPPASKGNIVAQAISNADQRRAEPAGGAAAAGVETGDLTGAPTPRPT